MSHTVIPRTVLCLSSRSSICASARAIESPGRHRYASSSLQRIQRYSAYNISTLLRASTLQCPSHTVRSFSIGTRLQKKAGKANLKHARSDSAPPVSFAGALTPTDDAYDVSGLETQILKAIEKLTHELSQLRGGGKLNPEIIESLKVQLGTAGQGKDGKESVRLGDIAQVVPRGRMLSVVCGEEAVRCVHSGSCHLRTCVANYFSAH